MKRARIGSQLLTLGFELAAPMVLYYGLRSAGVGNVIALSVGAIPPGLVAAVTVARQRKIDQLAVLVMTTMLASIGLSVVTGSARFLLAKDGILTGVWGGWFLLSLRAHRPAAFLFTRPLLEGRKAFTSQSWDGIWEREPAFRRIWQTSTVMWGTGLLLDAGARVVMAYRLQVSVVPALGGALYPATFVVLQVVTNVYYHRAGLWTQLGARWAPRIEGLPRSRPRS